VRELIAVALLAGAGVALYVGWRRRRFLRAFAAVAVALLGLWGASLLAIETDYRDGDGFVDCWPGCTAYQDAVGFAFLFPLAALVLVTAASAVAVAVSALRRRAARPHG
jgi:hypothetical protein